MNIQSHSQEWNRSSLHPYLPGEDLETFEFADSDDVCIYDPDNPDAYIVAEAVEVGTDE